MILKTTTGLTGPGPCRAALRPDSQVHGSTRPRCLYTRRVRWLPSQPPTAMQACLTPPRVCAPLVGLRCMCTGWGNFIVQDLLIRSLHSVLVSRCIYVDVIVCKEIVNTELMYSIRQFPSSTKCYHVVCNVEHRSTDLHCGPGAMRGSRVVNHFLHLVPWSIRILTKYHMVVFRTGWQRYETVTWLGWFSHPEINQQTE